jgi:GTP-binding protein
VYIPKKNALPRGHKVKNKSIVTAGRIKILVETWYITELFRDCFFPKVNFSMPVPQVVIVGRPNVGKSSIMNWLAGKFVSVVDPTAGVTRDRVEYLFHEKERYFELVDTGGIGIVDEDNLSEHIEHQIQIGIESADLILFVVDGTAGVTALDEEVASRVRKIGVPVMLVVNKCDSTKTDLEIPQFYKLMNVPSIMTSVKANRNRKELLADILEMLPVADEDEMAEGDELSTEPELKLAIVGRRNVGKSTFINAIAQTDRMIVSEVPGTTRDSVDLRFELDEKTFVAIDTPGVRKKKSLASDIEFYSLVRAQKSIRRADVVLMFFNSQETISSVDKKLVSEIQSHYKPCIFVVNKWDLGKEAGMTPDRWTEYLQRSFSSMRHVPVAYITAKDDHNTKRVINLAQSIYKQSILRMSTGKLNKIVHGAMDANPAPMRKGRIPKIYFATQVAIQPPTIVLKVNDPEIFDTAWQRYMAGVLRETLPFKEVPIKIIYRPRTQEESEDGN